MTDLTRLRPLTEEAIVNSVENQRLVSHALPALLDCVAALEEIECERMRLHPIAGYMFDIDVRKIASRALAALDNRKDKP